MSLEDLDQVIEELKKRGIKHNDDYDVVGVGDVVEDVLSAFGITQERFKKWFNLSACACEERKKWMNSVFYWRRKRNE